MRRNNQSVENIDDLAGLATTNPVMATLMTILMFSLAGIPPLAGFWAKWYVFLAAIQANLLALSVIGVLASVVGAYYYLRIIKIMWFDEARQGFLPMPFELRAVLGVSGAFVLFYVVIGGPIAFVAQAAAGAFFH
jgi:NADH-quinone oxidoreductase subunit N